MDNPRLVVIGSLNTDLITRTSRVPAAGETLISKSFDTGSGGKGANQAVACARLSTQKFVGPQNICVCMVGAVGDDTFGHELVEGLQNNYIDITGVTAKEGEKTGVAVIIVEEQTGENRILMSPNTNFSLKPEDFTTLSDFGKDFTPTRLPSLIVLQLEIPLDTTLQILKVASEHGIDVLLNPAPAQVLPKEAYAAVNHLIINESEAAIVTNTADKNPEWSKWGKHFDRIVALGVRNVVITLGAEGVIYLETRQKKLWRFEAEKVNVVDTTAAGDTFVGAYAVAVTTFAVRWANTAAAKTVERSGAQGAIPWLDEVPAYWEEGGESSVSFDEWRRR